MFSSKRNFNYRPSETTCSCIETFTETDHLKYRKIKTYRNSDTEAVIYWLERGVYSKHPVKY